MSKRSDLLLACMLGNRWRASVTSIGASVAAASPTLATEPNSRIHLESIAYSIKNFAYGAALPYTVSVQVRGASNTVLATLADHVVSSSAMQTASIAGFAFANPKRGTGLSVAFNTAAGSVTQSVSITGWIEDTNG